MKDNVERSFQDEVRRLSLGAGEVFRGEDILAVTKALPQAGVSYVGGYQGAPVSHLIDVLGDARPLLDELGIHFENSASEAGAAAMLGASIHYPVRGAVTWKSTVGTNVASDALSNLASAGVVSGAVIVLGEGSSIIQERRHAFAIKSQIWLLDPRPNLTSITEAVERSFELIEATNTPVMLQLRIRACQVHGEFVCNDNRAPAISPNALLAEAKFDYGKICLPPSTYAHEKQKTDERWPAALNFIRRHKLNETFNGSVKWVGVILQGGLYNGVLRAFQQLELADAFGATQLSPHVLKVVYPLVSDEIVGFCSDKTDVLVIEEGQPNYIEDAIEAILRKAGRATHISGKSVLPMAGESTDEVPLRGISRFLSTIGAQGVDRRAAEQQAQRLTGLKAAGAGLLDASVLGRPPGFCVGCPERQVFSAIKLLQQQIGQIHVSADIGCHTFGTLPPFNVGSTVLVYGLGLANSSGLAPLLNGRLSSIMGDGGFWHNGFTSGVVNAVHNRQDSVLLIMKSGYTSATGTQNITSSVVSGESARHAGQRGTQTLPLDISKALKGVGVEWIKTVPSYKVSQVLETLSDAMATRTPGLKVIIADGECQLERQRHVKPLIAKRLKQGKRVLRPRFGIDGDVCTGDHSCIRLSGCPSLTLKPNPSALRTAPVATANQNCVGCGPCGEVSHAAVLCHSFYKAEIVQNPSFGERAVGSARAFFIQWLAGARATLPQAA